MAPRRGLRRASSVCSSPGARQRRGPARGRPWGRGARPPLRVKEVCWRPAPSSASSSTIAREGLRFPGPVGACAAEGGEGFEAARYDVGSLAQRVGSEERAPSLENLHLHEAGGKLLSERLVHVVAVPGAGAAPLRHVV